jgi:hypothetical protein
MKTYTKTENIIDYTAMGLLAISVILTVLNIPYASICMMIVWCLSIGVFMGTSVNSKLYKVSVPLFVLDLFCKINIFSGIKFWNIDSGRNYISIGMTLIFVIYLIDAIMTKKAPSLPSIIVPADICGNSWCLCSDNDVGLILTIFRGSHVFSQFPKNKR